jgi:tetratricopeptide (TPR) repeat protein
LGKKRTGTWKYLYLSIACMISVLLAGCVAVKSLEANKEARERLITAKRLFERGDYEGSLKENQKILSLYDHGPPGDEALFNTATIYAHEGYSKRDYGKSLNLFRRLVKMFPQSPWVGQAETWVGIIRENQKLNRELEELHQTLRMSKQENERLKREVRELNQALKKSKQIDIEVDETKRELLR